MSDEEKISRICAWFADARPWDSFIRSVQERETGVENPAYCQFVRQFSHIRTIVDSAWIKFERHGAVLTDGVPGNAAPQSVRTSRKLARERPVADR
ncbi:hypothetical protein D9X30_3311 [Cupriavidus sp. U2]|uniref:hypothetical protein n=1 Tax=Cupriavidus sp. U2 TaxID=2920269 RepID=UPI00129DCD4E|nr:hypothetical protein [Cupriavidus sp. U2]KAI3591786.1 hypothetical protein D9X30_3311 [Cupriavidus sp. U2]